MCRVPQSSSYWIPVVRSPRKAIRGGGGGGTIADGMIMISNWHQLLHLSIFSWLFVYLINSLFPISCRVNVFIIENGAGHHRMLSSSKQWIFYIHWNEIEKVIIIAWMYHISAICIFQRIIIGSYEDYEEDEVSLLLSSVLRILFSCLLQTRCDLIDLCMFVENKYVLKTNEQFSAEHTN